MMTTLNSRRQNIPPSQPSEAEGWQLDMGNGLPQVEATCGIWVPESAGSTNPESGDDPSVDCV